MSLPIPRTGTRGWRRAIPIQTCSRRAATPGSSPGSRSRSSRAPGTAAAETAAGPEHHAALRIRVGRSLGRFEIIRGQLLVVAAEDVGDGASVMQLATVL